MTVTSATVKTTVTSAKVKKLREAYRQAGEEINGMAAGSDEREIGLATLRQEATQTYNRLMGTPEMRDATVKPFKEYVSTLTGGESVEKLVATVDASGAKVIRDVVSSLYKGVALGAVGTIVTLLVLAATSAEDLGKALVPLLAGGSIPLFHVFRALTEGAEAGKSGWIRSWDWANGLGVASDRALMQARSLRNEIWPESAAHWASQQFTTKVRSRAKALLGVTWLLVALALLFVAIGVGKAAQERTKPPPPPDITIQFP